MNRRLHESPVFGFLLRLVLAHRAAIAFCAISLRRSGVMLAARFFAIATAPGSFFFAFSIPSPSDTTPRTHFSYYRKNGFLEAT